MQSKSLPLFLASLLFHLLILYAVSLVNTKKYYASPYRKVKIVNNELHKKTQNKSPTIPAPIVKEEDKLPIEYPKIEEEKNIQDKETVEKLVEPKPEIKKPDVKQPETAALPKPESKKPDIKQPETAALPKPESKKPDIKQPETAALPKPEIKKLEVKQPKTVAPPKPEKIEQKSIFDNVNTVDKGDDNFLLSLEKDIISSPYILTEEERELIKNSLSPNMVSLHNIIGSKNIDNLELIFRIYLDENAIVSKITVIKSNCEQILTRYQCERLIHDLEQTIINASPFPIELGNKIFGIYREYLIK